MILDVVFHLVANLYTILNFFFRPIVPSGNERDDVSLYGTPKEEIGPNGAQTTHFPDANGSRPGWVRNQLQNIFQPTDNKLAMKLFGSKKALVQERVRQKAAGHWIIHPCSSFR